MEQLIKVKILGSEYLVKSREDREEVNKVAELVNERFKEVEENTEGLSEKKTAILAAFHIASDYLHLMREHDDLLRKIDRRARALIYQIDSAAP